MQNCRALFGMVGSTLRLPGLAERLWDLKESLRLKRLVSPSVRWIRTGYAQILPECSQWGHRCLDVRVHPHQQKRLCHSSCSLSMVPRGSLVSRVSGRCLSCSAPSSQAPVMQAPGNVLPQHLPVDPAKLIQPEVTLLYNEIKRELWTHRLQLQEIANYYFDGQGKAFRPMVTILMARALNLHQFSSRRVTENQMKVAMIAEMIHTASLVHDDVVDTSDTRRGKPSCNVLWGQKKAILAGDFVLAQTSRLLAEIGNNDVTILIAQIFLDLVQGEFMQLVSKEDERERFAYYIQKTFKKTASLIAYTCKSVALLGEGNEEIQEAAFQYGRNLGIAFQLVDDLLDFISNSTELGKPVAADLKLGLATAPVLFACEKFPELDLLIMRRFSEPGDVERAYDAVMKSDGLDHTRMLAQKHANEALRYIALLQDSMEKQALIQLAEKCLNRTK